MNSRDMIRPCRLLRSERYTGVEIVVSVTGVQACVGC